MSLAMTVARKKLGNDTIRSKGFKLERMLKGKLKVFSLIVLMQRTAKLIFISANEARF